jgi:F0F1-type ATP synthase assembly protein I
MTENEDVKRKFEEHEKRIDKNENDISILMKKIDRIEIRLTSIESQLKIILAFIVPILILILGQMIRDPVIYINRYFFFGLALVSFIAILIIVRKKETNV